MSRDANLRDLLVARQLPLGSISLIGEHWTFLQAFLKSPRTVASVVRSSSFVEKRVVEAAGLSKAQVVVELGGGTGGITRALLAAMGPQAHLLVIERTAKFVEILERIDDPRLDVVHACASTICNQLGRHGHDAADAVVSGIPFSTMPRALAEETVVAVHEALAPGGRFVAYQLSDRVAEYARPLLGEPLIERELRNVPPMRVFTWHKE